MDAQLAAIYGTGNSEPDQNDLEKMAAAELLMKLAEEEGVDLNQFSDQEIAGMVNDLYKQAADEPPKEEKKEEHEKGESPEKEKKEEEKVAEADFLGRVMAHSMVHELREIEKEAGVKETAQKVWGAVSGAAKKGGSAVAGAAKKGAGAVSGAAKKSWEFAKAHPKAAIGTAAGAGGLAAGYAAGRAHEKSKKSSANESALEALAQQAAFNMAKEAGYIDDEGNFLVEPQEKQASALDKAVYGRALQICEENGIPVEWNNE